MMTREEAITNLEKLVALFHTESEQSKVVDYSKIIETLEFAAAALSTLQIENQALRNAANGFKAENAQLRHRLSEAISACSRIAEWAQNTGHDYVEGIAREFLEEDV